MSSDNQWFKVWGTKALASSDLHRLTDHEYRVWWQLVFVASNEEPRWSVDLPPAVLARMCDTTAPKLAAALLTMERLRMVRRVGNCIHIANAERYQETPEARRKRVQREREAAKKAGQVTDEQRDMSRPSHGHVPQSVTGEGEEEGEGDKSPSLRSGDLGAKPPKPKASKKILTDEQRAALLANPAFASVDAEFELEAALNNPNSLKALDLNKYCNTWLRRSVMYAAERKGNGRSQKPGREPDEYDLLLARQRANGGAG